MDSSSLCFRSFPGILELVVAPLAMPLWPVWRNVASADHGLAPFSAFPSGLPADQSPNDGNRRTPASRTDHLIHRYLNNPQRLAVNVRAIITVGERIAGHLGAWEVRVPKAQMVSRLQALLQHDLIELPDLPEAQLLADELKSFQVHQTVRGIRAEGEPGVHDDLVTALAVAVLFDPFANRVRPGPPIDW